MKTENDATKVDTTTEKNATEGKRTPKNSSTRIKISDGATEVEILKRSSKVKLADDGAEVKIANDATEVEIPLKATGVERSIPIRLKSNEVSSDKERKAIKVDTEYWLMEKRNRVWYKNAHTMFG